MGQGVILEGLYAKRRLGTSNEASIEVLPWAAKLLNLLSAFSCQERCEQLSTKLESYKLGWEKCL
jgi:hypothetical protein